MKATNANIKKLNPLNLSDLHHKLYMKSIIKFEDNTPIEWVNLFNSKYEYLSNKEKIRDYLRVYLKEEPLFIPEFFRINKETTQ